MNLRFESPRLQELLGAGGASYTSRVAKRICYIHMGPHKTGTKSIQWFLKENRAELLKHGYFVPESGNIYGGHDSIVRQLCGQAVPDHQRLAAAKFARDLDETSCDRVIISSEPLAGLLRKSDYAKAFFHRIEELNLEPRLVLFVRNQSQSINSRYAEVVKGFRRSEPFEVFAREIARRPILRYSVWIELADAFHAELVPRAFTTATITDGIVPEFLRSIGVDPSQFPDTNVRRNEAPGPFTVSVARQVLCLIRSPGKQLKWLQAERCKTRLATYLREKGLADAGYHGLNTELAQHIERELRSDNDMFSQRLWERPWAEIFAADIGQEFTPNDFDVCRPGWFTAQRLRRAVREMKAIADEILRDPALAVDTPWNDLRQRSG